MKLHRLIFHASQMTYLDNASGSLQLEESSRAERVRLAALDQHARRKMPLEQTR